MPQAGYQAPTRTQAAPTKGASTAVTNAGRGNAYAAAKLGGDEPAWTVDEAKAIQRELARLGLYTSTIDGDVGKGSRAALVEAFGGDEWKTLSAADALARLSAATPSGNEDGVRYGEMTKDGVLDVTIGVGFDETDAHLAQIAAIESALGDRGYEDDATEAATLLASTGRKVQKPAMGGWYVKRDAFSFKPPAGEARPVHVVVRFVKSEDGSEGGEAARAFEEGLRSSDVSMYGGHGRYGSGPDFDRNMRFELLGEGGEVEREIADYTVLEDLLAEEGKAAGKSAWTVYKERVAKGTLRTVGSNDGNVYLNQKNAHPGEFGSNLMYGQLADSGKDPATGADGTLGTDGEEKKYRLWLFNGCRTQDYVKSIRATPGATSGKDVGVMASTRTLYWSDIGETLAAFLDGLVATQSGSELTKGMDAKQDLWGGEKTNAGSFKQF
jgi:hypothetical protein